MSLVLGVRWVCDGPDCEDPNEPGQIRYTKAGDLDWIERTHHGATTHFCEPTCEIDFLRAWHEQPKKSSIPEHLQDVPDFHIHSEDCGHEYSFPDDHIHHEECGHRCSHIGETCDNCFLWDEI